MNNSIRQTTWHDLDAWTLETDAIRTVVVPDLGAKIVSLLDKRTQLEWLIAPGDRPLKPVPYGAVFTEQDMSGWDEMFPTIVACAHPAPGEQHGTPLPDHGEVWSLPWNLQAAPSPGALKLCVTGRALPYRLTRTLSYTTADTLKMHYELENLGQDTMPCLWAAHALFRLEEGMELIPPGGSDEIINAMDGPLGRIGERHRFPETTDTKGKRFALSVIPPKNPKGMQKYYFSKPVIEGHCGLFNPNDGMMINLQWDAEKLPWLGIWVNEGGWANQYNIGIEPATAGMDSPGAARRYGMESILKPYEIRGWELDISVTSRYRDHSR